MKTDSFCTEQNRVEFHRSAVTVTPTFDIALHTAKPEGDDQRSKEVDLAGYARVTVMRDTNNWIVRGRKVTNALLIKFPTVTKGKAKAKWLSIGISGKIRRLVELTEDVELKPNTRVEFEPGEIEIVEADK